MRKRWGRDRWNESKLRVGKGGGGVGVHGGEGGGRGAGAGSSILWIIDIKSKICIYIRLELKSTYHTNTNTNNRELTEHVWELGVLYNLKRNIQCAKSWSTDNYTSQWCDSIQNMWKLTNMFIHASFRGSMICTISSQSKICWVCCLLCDNIFLIYFQIYFKYFAQRRLNVVWCLVVLKWRYDTWQ